MKQMSADHNAKELDTYNRLRTTVNHASKHLGLFNKPIGKKFTNIDNDIASWEYFNQLMVVIRHAHYLRAALEKKYGVRVLLKRTKTNGGDVLHSVQMIMPSGEKTKISKYSSYLDSLAHGTAMIANYVLSQKKNVKPSI
jgi:hypothetical protein